MNEGVACAAPRQSGKYVAGRVRSDGMHDASLQTLATRAIEPNIFFDPLFLFPAASALNPKRTEILYARDADTRTPCFLLPFETTRPGLGLGPSVIRGWSTAFSPLGTPLVLDRRPTDILNGVLDYLADPASRMPGVLLLPDIRMDDPFAKLLQSIAHARGLPLAIIDREERPFLETKLDGETYLRKAIGAHHRRNYGRLWRRLSHEGALAHRVTSSPDEIGVRFEEFLALEASGWKGQKRTALAPGP